MVDQGERPLLGFNITNMHVKVLTAAYDRLAIWVEFDCSDTKSVIVEGVGFQICGAEVYYLDGSVNVTCSYHVVCGVVHAVDIFVVLDLLFYRVSFIICLYALKVQLPSDKLPTVFGIKTHFPWVKKIRAGAVGILLVL